MAMPNIGLLVRRGGAAPARVAFLFPFDKKFINTCKALKLRGLMTFGKNPVPVAGEDYSSWYADIHDFGAETYSKYAVLVRDYYTTDLRKEFDALFSDVRVAEVKASVHNPNKVMEADRAEVDALIEKYKDVGPEGAKGLEFRGSRHPAEGVVFFKRSMTRSDGAKGVINADSPRMAKTRQAVVGAIECERKNILVVTTLTGTTAVWPDQIRDVDPKATIEIVTHKNYNKRAQWTICHWDMLRLCGDRFFDNARTFDLLILDEAHYAANADSLRGKATARLAEQIPLVWELTGTPVTKRPKNAIHLLQLVRHPLVNSSSRVWHFLTHFCGEKDEWGRWDFNRAKNLDELHALLQDVVIRREKDQTNLPPKVRQIVPVHLNPEQRAAYDNAWFDFLATGDNATKAAEPNYPLAMVQTMVLRHAVALAKVPVLADQAEQAALEGKKVVIFTAFDDVWEAYAKRFGPKAVGIRGEVKPDKRAEAVHRFQNDPSAQYFIGNIRAASEAIPLWMGEYLFFNDISWLPNDQLQAEDRIVGGDKKTCFVMFFLAENTSDQQGFADFIKHKDITQRIINRRDENDKPIDAGFLGELPVARATEGPGGVYDVEMQKLGRLLEMKVLKSYDATFAESIVTQYVGNGKLSPKQLGVVKRIIRKYRQELLGLKVAP